MNNAIARQPNAGPDPGTSTGMPPANTFGGPSLQRFAYADLYRLSEAGGRYGFAPEKEHRYRLT